MSYKDFEVWQLAKEADRVIHTMTLTEIPKIDMWKIGTDLRRASKRTIAGIVDAYGRKASRQNFIKHLTLAVESNNDARRCLTALFESGALADRTFFDHLRGQLEVLDEKLNGFMKIVEREHTKKR